MPEPGVAGPLRPELYRPTGRVTERWIPLMPNVDHLYTRGQGRVPRGTRPERCSPRTPAIYHGADGGERSLDPI
jgi:hypothetical protein